MENIIIIAILSLILGSSCGYIWKEKKSGKKCIGCPAGCASCKRCTTSADHR